MQIQFAKMHGLGNDFMVVRWPAGLAGPSKAQVCAWADRRLGVGFDQLLIVTDAAQGSTEIPYRIFNQDGGEVEQCGNGARCVAAFLAPQPGSRLSLRSRGGLVEAVVHEEGLVTVNLGEPDFAPASLPFDPGDQSSVCRSDAAGAGASNEASRVNLSSDGVAVREQSAASHSGAAGGRPQRAVYRLNVPSGEVEFGAVSMGNPHAVIAVDSVDRAPVGILGPELGVHRAFAQGVNVGFAQFVDPEHVRLRVFERGAGETLACGTGAAATVAVGQRWGRLGQRVEVALPGGKLIVAWEGPGTPLRQTGPTTRVYGGEIES